MGFTLFAPVKLHQLLLGFRRIFFVPLLDRFHFGRENLHLFHARVTQMRQRSEQQLDQKGEDDQRPAEVVRVSIQKFQDHQNAGLE